MGFTPFVADLNVDFDRGGEHTKLLVDFMVELNLYSCDLSFPRAVGYTYQRDDGVARSWLDMFTAHPRRLMGWKDSACFFKTTANLWFKIWEEMGCPTSGVLFQIKKKTKTRYKYEVCHLQRRQNVMLQKKTSSILWEEE